jgi:hypothetical protein
MLDRRTLTEKIIGFAIWYPQSVHRESRFLPRHPRACHADQHQHGAAIVPGTSPGKTIERVTIQQFWIMGPWSRWSRPGGIGVC